MIIDNRNRIILGIAIFFLLVIFINPTAFYSLLGIVHNIAVTVASITLTIYLIRKM